ncbi:MAG: insulinase family protein, partial [Frankiaceae bacterium]|nr:insulinase family protein [Frankiaceae bacterium]
SSVAASGVSDEEVRRAKGSMRAGLVLGREDTGSRMSRLGQAELVHRDLLGVDALLQRIDAVTPDDVRAIAADVLTRPLSLGVVGPFEDTDLQGAIS